MAEVFYCLRVALAFILKLMLVIAGGALLGVPGYLLLTFLLCVLAVPLAIILAPVVIVRYLGVLGGFASPGLIDLALGLLCLQAVIYAYLTVRRYFTTSTKMYLSVIRWSGLSALFGAFAYGRSDWLVYSSFTGIVCMLAAIIVLALRRRHKQEK